MLKPLLFVVATFLALCPMAEAADNQRLIEIFEADQAARAGSPEDWREIEALDRKHRAEVLEMLQGNEIRTSNDFFWAAVVFQHGQTFEEYQLAFALARIAATINPEHRGAQGLSAAAWDRILMSKKQPQWYGTQYSRQSPEAPIELYTINESVVTDEERAKLNLPTLQEAKDKVW